MHRYDRDLVRYLLSWIPFGGPPAPDLFAEFGISPLAAYRRVNALMSSTRPLHPNDVELIADLRKHMVSVLLLLEREIDANLARRD